MHAPAWQQDEVLCVGDCDIISGVVESELLFFLTHHHDSRIGEPFFVPYLSALQTLSFVGVHDSAFLDLVERRYAGVSIARGDANMRGEE